MFGLTRSDYILCVDPGYIFVRPSSGSVSERPTNRPAVNTGVSGTRRWQRSNQKNVSLVDFSLLIWSGILKVIQVISDSVVGFFTNSPCLNKERVILRSSFWFSFLNNFFFVHCVWAIGAVSHLREWVRKQWIQWQPLIAARLYAWNLHWNHVFQLQPIIIPKL